MRTPQSAAAAEVVALLREIEEADDAATDADHEWGDPNDQVAGFRFQAACARSTSCGMPSCRRISASFRCGSPATITGCVGSTGMVALSAPRNVGEAPVNAKFYNQYIEQAPLVTATGAHYIAAHSVPRPLDGG